MKKSRAGVKGAPLPPTKAAPMPSTKPGSGKKMPANTGTAKGAASDQKTPPVAKRAKKMVVGDQKPARTAAAMKRLSQARL